MVKKRYSDGFGENETITKARKKAYDGVRLLEDLSPHAEEGDHWRHYHPGRIPAQRKTISTAAKIFTAKS